jgi:hypothetical protein
MLVGSTGAGPLLTVTNRVSLSDRSQDETFEFTQDGQVRRFGRDHEACDIVVWQAHRNTDLARVAGEIWRWGDELWVRNLSTEHELGLILPGQPPDQPLRARRPGAKGAACSIPAPLATLVAPGECLLEVQQIREPVEYTFSYGLQEQTLTAVPPVPAHLRGLAAALCEPLLLGHQLPAAHTEIMARLQQPSRKIVRGQIAELCDHYLAAAPEFAQRVAERQRRQEAAQAPMPTPVLRGGVYRYEETQRDADEATRSRQKSLSLPSYFEVAHLLVRYYRITVADLDLLPPNTAAPQAAEGST